MSRNEKIILLVIDAISHPDRYPEFKLQLNARHQMVDQQKIAFEYFSSLKNEELNVFYMKYAIFLKGKFN